MMAPAGVDDGRDTAALLDAIVSDPDDPAPYLVLADALIARGDPRGELIAIQHARTLTPTRELAAAEKRLLEDHRVRILGGRFARAVDAFARRPGRAAVTMTWRFGFLHRVAIEADEDAVQLVDALVASPAARVLDSLDLLLSIGNQPHMNRLLETLAARCPPTLRALHIASGFCDVVALRGAWPRLQRLRTLRIGQWGGIDLGAFELPALEDLELVGPRRSDIANVLRDPPARLRRLYLDLMRNDAPELAASLFAAPLPTLRDVGLFANGEPLDLAHLELGGIRSLALRPVTSRTLAALVSGAGEPLRRLQLHFEPGVQRADVQPIFDGALPHLRELCLGDIDGRSLLGELLASRILPTLRVVDLVALDEDDLARLADEAPRLAHLEQLRLVTPPTFAEAAYKPLLARIRQAVQHLGFVEGRLLRAVDEFRDA